MDAPADVYAVGDVHGDYDRLVKLLTVAGLIPAAPDAPGAVRWKAGKAVLVCTGDLVDKGPASVKVVELFQALQKAAEAEGGRVVVTMGNHEAEFLNDPAGEKTADFAADLRRENVKPEDVAAGAERSVWASGCVRCRWPPASATGSSPTPATRAAGRCRN